MLQAILDIILYIPRRILGHFNYIHELEQENAEYEIRLRERDLTFKRISSECDYNMKVNNYGNNYRGFSKIKELAQTFPDED